MKLPKVLRPEIEIECNGICGLLCAIVSIFKIGIKRATFDITFKGHTASKQKCLVIPRYKIKKAVM